MTADEIVVELKTIIDPRMRTYWVGRAANLIDIIKKLPATDQLIAVKIEIGYALSVRDIYLGSRNSGQWRMHINRAISAMR